MSPQVREKQAAIEAKGLTERPKKLDKFLSKVRGCRRLPVSVHKSPGRPKCLQMATSRWLRVGGWKLVQFNPQKSINMTEPRPN